VRARILLPFIIIGLYVLVTQAQNGPLGLGERAVDVAIAVLEGERHSYPDDQVAFTVEPGEGGAQIAGRLASKGLIRNTLLFRLLVQRYGVERDLRAGRYSLPASTNIKDLIAVLTKGQQQLVTVTVPEGLRIEEVAQLFERQGIGDTQAFLRLALQSAPNVEDGNTSTASTGMEGYLFPDTYLVPKEFSAADFLGLMEDNFEELVTSAMRQQATDAGLTLHQVVTLASIVEREAAHPEEQPLIASVYLNRLREDWKLDADPTVQYSLVRQGSPAPAGGYWKKELTIDDLAVNSPYNTYAHPGLPPGPIDSPGLSSIRSVLQPAQSNYFYFVAKQDGTHAFASSFDEHLQNIARYQK